MQKLLALAGSLALALVSPACSSSGAAPMAGMGTADGGHFTGGDGGMTDMDGMAPAAGDLSSTAIAAVTVDAVYVVNGADASISVVDAAKGTVIGTIKLQNASFPHHIYLSPDRSMLSVAIPGMDLSGGHNGGMEGMTGAVMILDAKTGATMASRRLDAMNHNAAFSPDGSEVWTSAMTMGGKVLVLDAMTLKTKSTINVGDMPAEVTFSKDGKLAFTANGMSNDVSVIDVATKKVTKTIAVDKDPVGAWPGDNGKMYVDCETSKTVKTIDPATLSVTGSYNLGFTPGMARTTPAGDALWVTNVDSGKVVVDMVSMDMTMSQVATGTGAHGITFSADGKTAFVTNQGEGSLSILDVAGAKVRTKVTVGGKPNGLVFRTK